MSRPRISCHSRLGQVGDIAAVELDAALCSRSPGDGRQARARRASSCSCPSPTRRPRRASRQERLQARRPLSTLLETCPCGTGKSTAEFANRQNDADGVGSALAAGRQRDLPEEPTGRCGTRRGPASHGLPSPSRLNASTVSTTAPPGGNDLPDALEPEVELGRVASMTPQSGSSSFAPMPKKAERRSDEDDRAGDDGHLNDQRRQEVRSDVPAQDCGQETVL